MSEPRKYIDMVISANEYADEKVKEKRSVSWVQERDSFLSALCFHEIVEHKKIIYPNDK